MSIDMSGVECLDAALWYERSTLEALAVALSVPPDGDDVLAPLLRERRMARLLTSVETAALNAQLDELPHTSGMADAIGAGWACVLEEHDAELRRLVERVDAAAASESRLSQTRPLERSPLESASGEQAR